MSLISQSLLELMSIESVMPSSHLILCRPLLLPSIFSSIRVFSNKSALCIRWPNYWSFSFNISSSNEYSGLIPLRWTGWITLQSKGLSRVFSNTTVQKHPFFTTQLSLESNCHRGTKCYSPALTAIQNDTVQNDTVSIQSDTYVSKSSLKL